MFLDGATFTASEPGLSEVKDACLNILTEVYSVLLLIGPWGAGFVAQAMSKQLTKQEEMSVTEEGERLVRFAVRFTVVTRCQVDRMGSIVLRVVDTLCRLVQSF